MSPTPPTPKQLTVKAFADFRRAAGWPSERTLRHLIFDAANNGFDAVIRRPTGRRILIDIEAFDRWVAGATKSKSRRARRAA